MIWFDRGLTLPMNMVDTCHKSDELNVQLHSFDENTWEHLHKKQHARKWPIAIILFKVVARVFRRQLLQIYLEYEFLKFFHGAEKPKSLEAAALK